MTEFELVKEALPDRLAFLRGFGFTLHSVEEQKSPLPLLPDGIRFTYVAETADREIRVYYYAARKTSPARFTVHVSKIQGDSASLDNYLTEHGGGALLQAFSNSEPKQPLPEFCNTFAAALERICNTIIPDGLTGKSWPFPPFDWGPYK